MSVVHNALGKQMKENENWNIPHANFLMAKVCHGTFLGSTWSLNVHKLHCIFLQLLQDVSMRKIFMIVQLEQIQGEMLRLRVDRVDSVATLSHSESGLEEISFFRLQRRLS
jgi:hypothetical protein